MKVFPALLEEIFLENANLFQKWFPKKEKQVMKNTVISVFMFCATVLAQGGVLSVEDCVNMAIKTHPAVQSARMAHQSSLYTKRIAIASALPVFKMEYSYTWLDEQPKIELPGQPPTTLSGELPNPMPPPATIPLTLSTPPTPPTTIPAGSDEIESFTVSATQPLFTGGATWNAWQLAKLQERDAVMQVKQAEMEVAFQVRRAFYGVLKAIEFVDVAGKALEMAESLRKRAQDFYDVGLIAKNDVLEAEVRVAEAKQNLTTAKSGLSIAKSALNILIGRPRQDEIEVQGKLEMLPFALSLEDCINKGLAQRPEVISARLRVEMAERLMKIERAGWFPMVAAVGAYKHEEGAFSSDPEQWSFTLAATWTFWEWGKKYYKVKSAGEMVGQARQAVRFTEDQVTLEIKEAYFRLREAETNLETAKTGLVSAEENLRVVQAKFDQNMATSFDVITAQTLLTKARTSVVSALADYMTAKAALDRAMGVYPPVEVSSPPSAGGQTQPQSSHPSAPAQGEAPTNN